jgi:hypothetical protein
VRGDPLPVLVVIDAFVGMVVKSLCCLNYYLFKLYLVQYVVGFYAVLGVLAASPGVVITSLYDLDIVLMPGPGGILSHHGVLVAQPAHLILLA